MKRILLWTVSLLLVAGAIFIVYELATLPRIKKDGLVVSVSAADHFRDNKDSKIVLVEYSDFQCPACGAYYPLLKQLHQEFGEKIAFVYRHFPLDQHKNALAAAIVAEAASKQGKFWEMHDLIFENQAAWSESNEVQKLFEKYAQDLRLDLEKFSKDLDDPSLKLKIEADRAGGVSSKIQGTPTFFLNGVQLENPKNYDEFRKLIEDSLKTNP